MLVTSALSLFFVFWGVLFLIDFYLRNTHNTKYLYLVQHYGLSITPFHIRVYVNKIGTDRQAPLHLRPINSVKIWTYDQRKVRLLRNWFSIGASIGLLCCLLTPFYLLWLLVIEVFNGLTLLKFSASEWPSVQPGPVESPAASAQQPSRDEGEYFKTALSRMSEQNSLFYLPLQEHVQTGITPVIPGVNIPWAHLPLLMFVLIFAGAFHEFGHAIAALTANVRLNGFGIFLFAVYPGAFTEIESDELLRSPIVHKLRIFSAGIWHNIILAVIGIFILWATPYCLFPFYAPGKGIVITDVNQKSGLFGPTGLQSGMVVRGINECEVRNALEWTECLEKLHERQKLQLGNGYMVHHSKVLPMTASSDHIVEVKGGGEVQCCSEFENVTLTPNGLSLSHICFYYRPGYNTLSDGHGTNAGHRFLDIIGPGLAASRKGASNASSIDVRDPISGSIPSGNVAKNRVRRANVKMNLLREMMNVSYSKGGPVTGGQAVEEAATNTPKVSTVPGAVSHACLPAMAITEHASCDPTNGANKYIPSEYVCVAPALYNGTALIKFQLQNRTKPVLFIGFPSEALYLVNTMDLTPRSDWFPYWIPLLVELLAKYLMTFSLAMGLLNAVPCYGLDGQFVCRIVIDYFCSKRFSSEQRQRLVSTIVALGTGIFALNVVIGMTKFLYNYSK